MLEFRENSLQAFFYIYFLKVKTKKGICHLNINFTLGWPPQAVYEMFTDPRNMGFFHSMGKYKDHFRTRLVCLNH